MNDDEDLQVRERELEDTLATIGARSALEGTGVRGGSKLLRLLGSPSSDLKRAGVGALAGYGAAALPSKVTLRALSYLDRSSPRDSAEFARALQDIQSERLLRPGARPLKIDVGPRSGPSFTTSSASRFVGRGAELGAPPDVYRGYAKVREGDVNALFHELGHATGKLGFGAGAHRKWAPLVGGSYVANKHLHRAAAPILGALANSAHPDDVDDLRTYNNIASAASGLLSAPMLVEEARASLRAKGLAQRFGSRVNPKVLGLRYGQYAAEALAPIIGRHLAVSHMLDRRARADDER